MQNTRSHPPPELPPYTVNAPPPRQPKHVAAKVVIGSIVVFTLLVVGMCVAVTAAITNSAIFWTNRVPVTTTTTQTFLVNGPATIQVNNQAGNIQIVAGSGPQITMVTTKRASDVSEQLSRHILTEITSQVMQTGATIQVTGKVSADHPFTQQSIDYVITVPPQTRLNLQAAAGNITASGISGPLTVKVNAGNVTLSHVTLMQSTTLTANAGNITIDGTIASDASVQVTVDAGNVTMRLPSTVNTALQADTSVGNVTVEGWPVSLTHAGTKVSATGILGTTTASQLRIHVSAGNVEVSATK